MQSKPSYPSDGCQQYLSRIQLDIARRRIEIAGVISIEIKAIWDLQAIAMIAMHAIPPDARTVFPQPQVLRVILPLLKRSPHLQQLVLVRWVAG